MKQMKLSILFPRQDEVSYREIPEESWHDLGLDALTEKVAAQPQEEPLLRRVMMSLTADPAVAAFRSDVFDDILRHPEIRERLLKLLDKVKMFYDYGVVNRHEGDETGIWDLMHRLEEYHDYIQTVEAIRECLSDKDLVSEGLTGLRDTVEQIYREQGFAALRKDVEEMRVAASEIKSLTVGINLNDRFEAISMGLVSVNAKPFTKSNLLKNFLASVTPRDAPQPAGGDVPGPDSRGGRRGQCAAADGQRRVHADLPDCPEAAGYAGTVPERQRERNRRSDSGTGVLYPLGGIY